MKKIFIGFLFVVLNFNFTADNVQIELLPDFLGYFIMLSGLSEMERESSYFVKVKPYTLLMAIYTLFLFVFNLVGFLASLGAIYYVFATISVVVSFYISYNIVMGIRDIEKTYKTSLNGDNLMSTWKIYAICYGLSIAFTLVPLFKVICLIGAIALSICFLMALNKSKNMYYSIMK